ncbi:MAG: WD40 repeat domain-containing protein [Flavobacteriales bacterium]
MESVDNPYVGLRPFNTEESLLFFGRNEQTLQLLIRLHKNRFVAVVGGSGSGKSSLLRAGLMPALRAGYLVNHSDNWLMGIMKPGDGPLSNLAVVALRMAGQEANETSIRLLLADIQLRGIDAILALFKSNSNISKNNCFLLVDQFEELFRFALRDNGLLRRDEATDFVNLLLALIDQTEIPFFVVVTMRSDFIGDCVQFRGLPEAMNESQYLVPRLTRSQLKVVIEGPAKLFGSKVHPSLLAYLLNEVVNMQDELPVLQHALMRIWDYESLTDHSGELDIIDSDGVGGLDEALSRHADEALVGVTDRDKNSIKLIFQSLTAIDDNGRKIRRPALLSELMAITGESKEKVLELIERFIDEKRSFLVVSNARNSIDKVIDISHESLIRQWTSLGKWVEEEGNASEHYLKLATYAGLYAKKQKDLLSGTELEYALAWRNTFQPSNAWAIRYDPDFLATMEYLRASEAEKEQLSLVEQKRRWRLKVLIWAVFGLVSLVAVGVGLWAISANHRADDQELIAKEQKRLKDYAEEQKLNSDSLAKIADNERKETKAKNVELEIAKRMTDSLNKVALKSLEIMKLANFKEKQATEKELKTLRNLERQYSAFMLHMQADSAMEVNPTEALELEKKAIQFLPHPYFEKAKFDIYNNGSFYKVLVTNNSDSVYYDSDSTFKRIAFDRTQNTEPSIYQVIFSPDSSQMAILLGYNSLNVYDSYYNEIELKWHNAPITCMAFSSDTDRPKMVTGSADNTACVWDYSGNLIGVLKGHTKALTSVNFSPDGSRIITSSLDGTIREWLSPDNFAVEAVNPGSFFRPSAMAKDGSIVTGGFIDNAAILSTSKGDEVLLEGASEPISAVDFSEKGNFILTGSMDNYARLYTSSGKFQKQYEFSGAVGALKFIDSESFVAGCFDGNVQFRRIIGEDILSEIQLSSAVLALDVDNLNRVVVCSTEDNMLHFFSLNGKLQKSINMGTKINSIDFSENTRKIILGCEDGTLIQACFSDYSLLEVEGCQSARMSGNSDVLEVAVSPDSGKYVLAAYLDKTIRLWRMKDGKVLMEFDGHTQDITSLAFDYSGSTMLLGFDNGKPQLIDMPDKFVESKVQGKIIIENK